MSLDIVDSFSDSVTVRGVRSPCNILNLLIFNDYSARHILTD